LAGQVGNVPINNAIWQQRSTAVSRRDSQWWTTKLLLTTSLLTTDGTKEAHAALNKPGYKHTTFSIF
jgi:hypothetical protein